MFHTEIGLPHVGTTFCCTPQFTARARAPCKLLSLLLRCGLQGIIINTIVAAFNSTIAIAADQLATAPQLEPAFEHLLRNSTVHESVIGVLRINSITDRDTFVSMFDSEEALKDGASDLGFDLSTGGLPHKREFARVVTS